MAEVILEDAVVQHNGESLAELIDRASDLREQYRKANKIADDLKREYNALTEVIMYLMKQADTTMAGSENFRASYTTEVMPTAKDWEQIFGWVKEHEAWHLLIRQLNAASYRELLNSGATVPGVEPFEKEKLSITKATRRRGA